ncbi:hypothetical protein [Acetobacter ascendens]|uniref:hypothetical protein n=1 Tax=Acetobacter ascendens TaxID=481146 RepID=UPI00138FADAA|nr:hypothetical protein [Acetobacter ascendens]
MATKDACVTLTYKVGGTTVTEKCEITSQDAASVLNFIQSLPSVQEALPAGYKE